MDTQESNEVRRLVLELARRVGHDGHLLAVVLLQVDGLVVDLRPPPARLPGEN